MGHIVRAFQGIEVVTELGPFDSIQEAKDEAQDLADMMGDGAKVFVEDEEQVRASVAHQTSIPDHAFYGPEFRHPRQPPILQANPTKRISIPDFEYRQRLDEAARYLIHKYSVSPVDSDLPGFLERNDLFPDRYGEGGGDFKTAIDEWMASQGIEPSQAPWGIGPQRNPPPEETEDPTADVGFDLEVQADTPEQAEDLAAKLRAGIEISADICEVTPSVCVGNLGIPRSDMPQFDDPAKRFLQGLQEDRGISVENTSMPVGKLKATQREINARKVFGMLESLERGSFPSIRNHIIVSSDDYILDGHHRWATLLVNDPGNEMKVFKVDMPIYELLIAANASPGVTNRGFADLKKNPKMKARWAGDPVFQEYVVEPPGFGDQMDVFEYAQAVINDADDSGIEVEPMGSGQAGEWADSNPRLYLQFRARGYRGLTMIEQFVRQYPRLRRSEGRGSRDPFHAGVFERRSNPSHGYPVRDQMINEIWESIPSDFRSEPGQEIYFLIGPNLGYELFGEHSVMIVLADELEDKDLKAIYDAKIRGPAQKSNPSIRDAVNKAGDWLGRKAQELGVAVDKADIERCLSKIGKRVRTNPGHDWIQEADDEMEADGTEGAFTKQARRAGYGNTMEFAFRVMEGWRSGKKKVYNKKTRRMQGITAKTMRRANFALNAQKRLPRRPNHHLAKGERAKYSDEVLRHSPFPEFREHRMTVIAVTPDGYMVKHDSHPHKRATYLGDRDLVSASSTSRIWPGNNFAGVPPLRRVANKSDDR